MLKRSLIFTLVLVSLISTSWVLAADPATPSYQKTSIGSAQIDGDKVKALKERLATKVAELRENQTRVFFGEIAALSKTSFTLASQDQEVKVRYNEDVTVYKLDATNKKIEAQVKDLKNTQGVSVLGVFEPDSKQQSAKIIFLQTLPKFYFGEVVGTDKTKGTIQIKTGQKGQWHPYVLHDLLPRIYGFELMMTPYTIAHLKLSLAFRDTGFKYFNDRRLGIYLTNSLEESGIQQQGLFALG